MSEPAAQQKPAPAVGQRWESPNGIEVREIERIEGQRAYFTIGSWEGFDTMLKRDDWRYLGPLPGKAAVEVGQRWAPKEKRYSGPSFVITGENDDLNYGWPVTWDGSGGGGYWRTDDILETCTLVASPPTEAVGVTGERGPMGIEPGTSSLPVNCLGCGGDKRGNGWVCDPCTETVFGWGDLITAWGRGARDFPRRQPGDLGASGASDGIMPQKAEYKIVGIDWGAGVPVKREVSTNGRDWLPYDTLTDADPFTSYRHRRENGVVVLAAADETTWCGVCGDAVALRDRDARGYCWRCHKERDTDDRYNTDENSRRASAANPAIAPPSPIDPTPGAGIPERRAYRTPSGES